MASTLLSVLAQIGPNDPTEPASAFFGFMGVASALIFASIGAAYGTAKAGVGVATIGVNRPDIVMKSIIPVIMAGMVGIYGLIIAIFLSTNITSKGYSAYRGFANLAAGLTTGLSSLAAGMCIGVVGDAGVRANAQQEKLFVGMILMLVFAEALGLYGLIIGLILAVTS